MANNIWVCTHQPVPTGLQSDGPDSPGPLYSLIR